jgi:paraquat-inducible protein A
MVCRLGEGAAIRCRHCGELAHARNPRSLEKASAYLATAAIFYVPANLLPVMHTHSLLADQDDTILSGVIFLVRSGSLPLAALVFVASILVPLLKILAIGLLIWMSARESGGHRLARARLYRFVDYIGRWSLLDIFAVMMLGALVQMGSMATVQPGSGALAFGAVVVLTLLAAESFDPRVIWDGEDVAHG